MEDEIQPNADVSKRQAGKSSEEQIDALLDPGLQKCAEAFHVSSEKRAQSLRMCSSVLKSGCAKFSEFESAKKELIDIVLAAGNLQLSLGCTGRVHVVIEKELTKLRNDRNSESQERTDLKRVSIMPIFSPTLIYCLLQSCDNPEDYSSFSSQFMDLFARAERSTSRSASYTSADGRASALAKTQRQMPLRDPMVRKQGTPPVNFSIPDWFRNTRTRFKTPTHPPERGPDIFVEPTLYNALGELPFSDIEKAWGSFFSILHDAALSDSNITKYKGPIVYHAWTPPWLRCRTVFHTGKRQTERLRFEKARLPNKQACVKKPDRECCRAILVEWLRRENSTKDLLLQELRKVGAEISDEHVSSCSYPPEVHVSSIPEPMEVVEAILQIEKPTRVALNPSTSTDTESSNPSKSKVSVISVRSSASSLEAPLLPDIVVSVGDEHIRPKGLETLLPDRWLNNAVVNAFFYLLKTDSVAVLNSWFYTRLTQGEEGKTISDGQETMSRKQATFEHLSRWVSKVELEVASYLLIPLHSEKSKHWGLLVAEKSSGTCQLYDSMQQINAFSDAAQIISTWCAFLKRHLSLHNWPASWTAASDTKSSIQTNNNDCGIFACINALYASRGVPTSTFPVLETNRLRQEIKQSILSKEIRITFTQ